MPKFSTSSMTKLMTCEQTIQTVMLEAIKVVDFTVLSGKRTAEEQFELWKKGRKLIKPTDPYKRKSWKIVNHKEVVTYRDGYEKKSNHQGEPKSKAVDITPYPIDWSNTARMHHLAGVIAGVQDRLFRESKITKKLDWGFDLWDFDRPHFQIRTK